MARMSAPVSASVQAAEIDGHEERGHLVIRDPAGGVGGDGFLELGGVQRVPVAFGLDEGKEVHAAETGRCAWERKANKST